MSKRGYISRYIENSILSNLDFHDISEYNSFDNFYFTSNQKRKEMKDNLLCKEPIVLILSGGGMGGTHLLCAAQKFYSENFKTIRFSAPGIISNIKNENFSCKKLLFSYDILFIDGFQEIADRAREEFESFVVSFINKGGRIFLKANPTLRVNLFKNFISQFGYREIPLLLMQKKLKMIILKNSQNMKEFESIGLKKNIKRMIVGLKFHSWRIYNNFLFMIYFHCTINKTKMKKYLVRKIYKQLVTN
jgi:chromosomal replication initiation ATPase DnaA